ncbi:AsnC family protein [Bacillus sp. SG-1]|uniref:AsnC family protein n=1 Tax=Bacillus sp. SG-1 TaxID=161544 RepID=UPI0001543E7D|nr:AsnC family protein [Bacillus sp. SG-1]EDL64994.1 hypothetical protein BSG1_14774 [Bacillus sp. SG-1]
MENRALIIVRGEEVKGILDPASEEAQELRLRSKYSQEKIKFIWEVENAYHSARETKQAGRLLSLLWGNPITGKRAEIQKTAEYYERRFSGYRVSRHDFESIFIEELIRLLPKGKTNDRYTFYETFKQALQMRALDVVRRESGQTNKQIKFEKEAVPFEEHHEGKIFQGVIIAARSTMEERAEAKDLVAGIMESEKLNEEERRLLAAMNENPEASFRELARTCGLSDHKKAKRTLEKIRNKMAEYNPFQ